MAMDKRILIMGSIAFVLILIIIASYMKPTGEAQYAEVRSILQEPTPVIVSSEPIEVEKQAPQKDIISDVGVPDISKYVMEKQEESIIPQIMEHDIPIEGPITTCATGCYLELASLSALGIIKGQRVYFQATKNECRNYALAFQFGERKDAVRLLVKEKPQLNASLHSEIANMPNNRVYRMHYVDCNVIDADGNAQDTHIYYKEFYNECKHLNFFDIDLYCFNGITRLGQNKALKRSNLKSIITPFVFLKLSGDPTMDNPLLGTTNHPFDYLIQENIRYVDASNAGILSDLNINDIGCQGGAANHQVRSPGYTQKYQWDVPGNGQSTIMFCREDGVKRKIHYAGILYHEGLHKYGGSHVCSINGRNGDYGLNSVYGSHATYLYQASMDINNVLTCPERWELYNEAVDDVSPRACGATFNWPAPNCQTYTLAPITYVAYY